MIAFLNGFIAELTEGNVVLEVGGIGFNVAVSNETASRLSAMGSDTPVRLYTYTHVREDQFSLYGFLTRDELALYKRLITVSGIGPKGGLSLLSAMSADDLRFAIVTGDVSAISKAPGIGKKTAERLVLDLRDKLQAETGGAEGFLPSGSGTVSGLAETEDSDAVQALVALGYPLSEARGAVKKAKEDGAEDVEALLKASLKYLI